jgi:hypothetical protein
LKDSSDDALRTVASRVVSKLTGVPQPVSSAQVGLLVVHAGTARGTIVVDGVERGSLENGVGKLDVPAGAHTIEVRVAGFVAASQPATFTAGHQTDLTFALKEEPEGAARAASHGAGSGKVAAGGGTEGSSAGHAPSSGGVSVRKILSWGVLGIGAGVLIFSGVEAIRFQSQKSDAESADSLKQIPANTTNAQYCTRNSSLGACQKYFQAADTRTLAFVTAGVGGALALTGVVLLVTDPARNEKKEVGENRFGLKHVQIVPSFGTNAGSVNVAGTF